MIVQEMLGEVKGAGGRVTTTIIAASAEEG